MQRERVGGLNSVVKRAVRVQEVSVEVPNKRGQCGLEGRDRCGLTQRGAH